MNASIDEILKMVSLQLGRRNIRTTDRFLEDLGAESADIANIVALTEERYKIVFKESEIARIATPADLFDFIQQKSK